MLTVEMTPRLLGFKIAGDFDDLNELYDAVWALTVANEDFPDDEHLHGDIDEQIMSTRLLALCYDIRHAYQGGRNIELKNSGLSEYGAKYHGIPMVEKNVVFSVEVVYPEAMYEALALNYLMSKRSSHLAGYKALLGSDRWPSETLLDEPSAIVRAYLAKLLAAVKKRASAGRFSRICKYLASGYDMAAGIYGQWVDICNDDYAYMTEKQRAESLSTVVRDLAEAYRHDQYREIKAQVDAYAKAHGVPRENVSVPGLYGWSEDIEW